LIIASSEKPRKILKMAEGVAILQDILLLTDLAAEHLSVPPEMYSRKVR
jgi:hypothetical protein